MSSKEKRDRLDVVNSMLFTLNILERSLNGWRLWIRNLSLMSRFTLEELSEMLTALWMIIPEEAYILLLVGAGLALIVGLFTTAKAFSLVGLVCLLALLSPFAESLIELLPAWAIFLIGLWFLFTFIGAILGKRVTENLISMTHIESERVLFIPVKMGDEYAHLFNHNFRYSKESWAAFDYDGNVSVHISKKDYLDFKENLSFDQLCKSFGNLYIEFFEQDHEQYRDNQQ